MGRTEVEIQFGKSEIPPGEGGKKNPRKLDARMTWQYQAEKYICVHNESSNGK